MELTWKNEQRLVKDLMPWTKNPRKITDEQMEQLKKSIERFNYAAPILINSDGRIVAGHMRCRAMIALGRGNEIIDVRVSSRPLTEEEFSELAIRDNKNGGDFEFDLLGIFSQDMLQDIGFSSGELDKIFKTESLLEEDEAPEPRTTTTVKVGDIYKIGEHVLICGDSTDRKVVERLMGVGTDGVKATMIHTDPPYNINYGASKHHPSGKIRSIENDKQSPDDWRAFCHAMYEIFKEFNAGDVYMWCASSPEGMKARLWLIETGCHWSATIIWKKQQLVFSPAKYQRIYEPCFYGWFDKSSFNGDRTQVEVWEIDRPRTSPLHPTMKPIELCEKAILNSSKRDDIVLDLFVGSGSTMVACQRTGRKCYAVELDPVYAQVVLDRMEKMFAIKAELIK